MTFAGLPAVMFVDTPTPEQFERFRSYRAIGIAGVARAMPPSWMDAHLPDAFRALAELKAPVTHYKICSTLDSSPTVGSIGRAIDIGASIFGETRGAAKWQPFVVAAPAIGRYQAFGNLFAASGDGVYRLDRHPVMQRHPVTPMDEADVRLHVCKQTSRAIGLIDFAAMKSGAGLERFDVELKQGRSLLALDIVDEETLQWVGALMWGRRDRSLFAIGSQGVEYALVAHWRAKEWLPVVAGQNAASEQPQIVAVSGSVSPITASQIDWAEANDFVLIGFAAEASLDEPRWQAEIGATVERAVPACRDCAWPQ
jgi:3-oxoisoapionate kinase